MSLKQYSLILLLTVLINKNYATQKPKISLAIILDVTGSMSNEIDWVRKGTVQLLDHLYKWRGDAIGTYVLLQFADDSSKVTLNSNYENIKNEITTARIHRRGKKDTSCTAPCYGAIKEVLEMVNHDSIVLVFTDANTNGKDLQSDIKKIAVHKRISIYVTLTAGCAGSNAANVYRDIVWAYNGDVFNVDHMVDVQHFELLAQILTGPPIVPSAEIFVDSTMTEFILTVTGRNAIITIFDPNQKYVSSKHYKMLTNFATVKMIQVTVPIPGRYTVEIVSETPYTGQVQTISDLKFNYGFAVDEPSSMEQTIHAPIKGYNTHIAISVSNAMLIESLEHVILSTTGDKDFHYKLQKKDDLYLTESFPIPSEPFKIQVQGTDRTKHGIKRLISPVIAAMSIDPPEINIASTNFTVLEGNPIYLICRITSEVSITASWTKVGAIGNLKFLESKQGDTLNYTIDKAQTSDSGEYICSAENRKGRTAMKSFVTVKLNHLHVYTPIKIVNVEVGEKRVELQCNVSHISMPWLFNGKRELPSGSQYESSNLVLFNVEKDFGGTYTCIGGMGTVEMHDDVQLNVMYPPTILNLINYDTAYTYSDKTHTLEIGNEAGLHIICAYDGNPIPNVKWTNQTGNIVSNKPNLIIDGRESGEFSCHAENILGKDIRKLKIIQMIEPIENRTSSKITTTPEPTTQKPISKPILHENYNKDIALKQNISSTVSCPILGDDFNVTWTLNGNSIDHLKEPDGSITFDSVHTGMNGELVCTASNSAGAVSALRIIDILRPPYDIKIEASTDNQLFVNDQYELKCSAEGHPEPWLIWKKNRLFAERGNSIVFNKLKSTDNGLYTCIAENLLGKVNKTIKLHVSDLPRSKKPESSSATSTPPYEIRIDASTDKQLFINDRYEMKCKARGKPEPDFYWTKNGEYFQQGSSIAFQKLQSTDKGLYACVAKNYLGKINVTLSLQVADIPQLNSSVSETSSDDFLEDDLFKSYFEVVNETTNLQKPETPQIVDLINSNDVTDKPPYNIRIVTENEFFVSGRYDIKCSALGQPEPNFYWMKNNEYLKQGSILTQKLLATENEHYMCVAFNYLGSINKTITLQVSASSNTNGPPYDIKISKSPDQNRILNGRYQMKCSARGQPKPNLRWMKNENLFIEENSIVFRKLQPSDQGKYTCIAKNLFGSVSTSTTLQVLAPPQLADFTDFTRATLRNKADVFGGNTILSTIQVHRSYLEANYEKAIEVFENQTIELNCSMSGNPLPRINWFKNNVLLQNYNQPILTYKKAHLKDSGIYKCIGMNEHGKTKAIFYLNVKKPNSSVSLSLPKPAFLYNPGDYLSINCTVYGNPLPTIRIHSTNIVTGTNVIFDPSALQIKNKFLFQERNTVYFNGNKIISAKHAKSLDRYSALSYGDDYVAHFTYIIKSLDSKDAGTYTCTAISPSLNVNKSIAIQIKGNPRAIDVDYKIFNISSNTTYKLECPVSRQSSKIHWYFNNKIIKTSSQLIPRGPILELPTPMPYHTGIYTCKSGVTEFKFKIIVQPVVIPTLIQNKYQEIKMRKGEFKILQCSIKSRHTYWFELVEKSESTTQEYLPLNKSQHYMVIADTSRIIMCSDTFYPKRGDIFQIVIA